MKKGILFICSTIILGCLSTTQLKAQDFDLDFYQYFNAHISDYPGATDARTAATKWRGSSTDGSIGPKVTMNNISARVLQNNRINSITVGDDNSATQNYVRFQLGHDDCKIILESTVDIKTVALVYRSSSSTATGVKISYGATADDVDLAPIVATAPSIDNSMAAPGQTYFFNIPESGIRYIVINRSTSTAPKLYRIAASSTAFSALPLNLLSFTAKADAFGKSVNLNWKTTNEVNTKEFSIERRTDNTEFTSVGTIASKNTDGVHNYTYSDNNPVSGNSYYRLKQIDKNGAFQYSEIQSVNIEGGVSVSLYPNPATDQLNLTHASASNASVRVLNVQGKTVAEENLSNGATTSTVNVSQLVSGTYVLILNNDGKQSTLKFIKK